ncbi:hypothetical protein [Microbacterium trichothecenolyticum]|uniref:Uncharacterized protein n=1 Tax=Microbacterium trichothecenolyticum TaxID=69370 RepID=A0ABU0TSW9_MICTR|nr:hypothetical protein [Microbacterium trichothecenolyticum]MDQ1122059.1 hypothetical protein [Microbacterium trichothecenolyticum]
MSTPENTENPPLTRRQLRELRQTGATPIITPETDAAPPAPTPEPEPEHDTASPAPVTAAEEAATVEGDAAPAPSTPTEAPSPVSRPSAFEPAFGDHGSELGVSGLTRRQVRAQEKIRTAAVPVISPDLEPALPGQSAPFAPLPEADPSLPAIFRPAAPAALDAPDVPEIAGVPAADEVPGPSVVNPALGSELLDGAKPDVTLPASFDQLISRTASASGAVSTPNALILSQTPTGVPLVGPVTATGEIMITGTFELPEGLGSIGHARGTTDGRDADAVLLDGELPPASSPTPIAASAAISTVKQPGEIIRPPAPEKGSKLLIGLIITTGALALAVAVTLVLAFTTGVFR